MLVVTDITIIHGELSQVFTCFWDPTLWPRITPHVKEIEMIEWEDTHQRFKMSVEANGKLHRMETVRDAVINARITYKQSQPPPFFDEHMGEWSFEQEEGGVRVTITHKARINESKAREILEVDSLAEAEALISKTLKRNGQLTMAAIKATIEGNQAASEASVGG
jgi:hypothetical protein